MIQKSLLMKPALFVFNFIPALLWAQFEWAPFAGNPIMDGSFDPGSIITHRPSVLFDGTTYHMWYGRIETGRIESMGYATSPDGIVWTLVDSQVLAPSANTNRFDSQDASQGWVIADGDTLKMWYWGNGRNIGNIGYAWSTDGINWTKVDGSGIDGSIYDRTRDGGTALALVTPCVVKDGGTYHMWYSRIVQPLFISRIAYATSPDGINWTNVPGAGTNGAVLDWGARGTFDEATVAWPAVLKTTDGFVMWYDGADSTSTNRLGCATSSDGINWTRVSGSGTKGACFDEANAVSVLEQNNLYQMWYGIFDLDVVHYATSKKTTAADSPYDPSPRHFALEQNYPNPFNPSTAISYQLSAASDLELSIYNVLRQRVRTLARGKYARGKYEVLWDGTDDAGMRVASGVYFVVMQAGEFVQTRKLTLMK